MKHIETAVAKRLELAAKGGIDARELMELAFKWAGLKVQDTEYDGDELRATVFVPKAKLKDAKVKGILFYGRVNEDDDQGNGKFFDLNYSVKAVRLVAINRLKYKPLSAKDDSIEDQRFKK